MIPQLFFVLLALGKAHADHPAHDIFYQMMLCDLDSGKPIYMNPYLATTRCGECNTHAFLVNVKFSCSDSNEAELFNTDDCSEPENDSSDDPGYASIKLDAEKCTPLDLARRDDNVGFMIRTFDFGYGKAAAVPEKTTAKRDVQPLDADSSASAPVATSSSSTLKTAWCSLALVALASYWSL